MKRPVWIVVLLAAAALAAWVGTRERSAGDTLPPSLPGRQIDVGGHRVYVVERGTGPALLLVHGFGASSADYEEHVLERLAKSHRAIAVDLFGFGWSERRDDFAYDLALWSDQLAGTLDALGFARASVVGHSMGGAVAAYFAAHHPDRIDRLVLGGALYPLDPGEIPVVFRALRTPLVGEVLLGLSADPSAPGFSPAYRERAREWYRIRGTRRAFLRYVRDPDRPAELAASYPRIAARTLVLHGSADASVPYAAMERAAPAIPGARIVRLADGGHFLLRDDADRFLGEVEPFLAQP
jgi:pimeloyl-ACP methyl ester carboxylesterase